MVNKQFYFKINSSNKMKCIQNVKFHRICILIEKNHVVMGMNKPAMIKQTTTLD